MATLYTQQENNLRKTWLLMGVFFMLVIGVGWTLSYVYQSPQMLYVAVALSVGMNIMSYWYSDKVALSLTGAKEATREEYRELWNITENLSITAGLPMPRLYVIHDQVPNAFATGRNKEHAAVAVTTGLLELLDRTELEGVIAHELSHIGNRDILVMTVAVVLAGFVSIIADYFIRMSIFGGRGRSREGGGLLIVIGIVVSLLAPLGATLMRLAISRRREFLADASGALLTRYPEGLARALEKISTHGGRMKRAHDATAHLFIVNPFGGKGKALHKLFMSHPSTEERITALRGQPM